MLFERGVGGKKNQIRGGGNIFLSLGFSFGGGAVVYWPKKKKNKGGATPNYFPPKKRGFKFFFFYSFISSFFIIFGGIRGGPPGPSGKKLISKAEYITPQKKESIKKLFFFGLNCLNFFIRRW